MCASWYGRLTRPVKEWCRRPLQSSQWVVKGLLVTGGIGVIGSVSTGIWAFMDRVSPSRSRQTTTITTPADRNRRRINVMLVDSVMTAVCLKSAHYAWTLPLVTRCDYSLSRAATTMLFLSSVLYAGYVVSAWRNLESFDTSQPPPAETTRKNS